MLNACTFINVISLKALILLRPILQNSVRFYALDGMNFGMRVMTVA